MMTSKGVETGSLFTFVKTIKSYAENFNTDNIYIVWDKRLQPELSNFRKDMSEGSYKATRDPEKNKDVYAAVSGIVEATKLLGVKNFYPGRLEADDAISWLASTLEGNKIIISVDKDFVQLIKPGVSLFNPIKKVLVDSTNVIDHFKISPVEYLYYKAIVGDVSDNIGGLEGFGEVKGTKLAKAFVANDTKVIEPYKERVEYNLKMVDLSYSLKQYPEEIELYNSQLVSLESLKADFDRFKALCDTYEFNSITKNFDDWKSAFSKRQQTDLLAEYFKQFE